MASRTLSRSPWMTGSLGGSQERQRDLLFRRRPLEVLLDLREQCVQPHVVALDLERPGLDLGHRKHLADDPLQPAGLAVDDVEAAGPGGGILLAFVDGGLDVQADVGQRRAKLVGGLGDEIVARPPRPPSAG